MSKTTEYLDYLYNEVGIAPAASQEELDLAQALADEYAKHGLKADVQEFPAQSLATLPYGVVMVLLFIGIVLAGVGSVVTTVIGLVLLVASIALLAATYFGNDVLAGFGPRAHSQNVVAMRPADEGNDRNRPIVILAHYDTPRTDLLLNMQFGMLKKYFPVIVPNAIVAVAVCALVQLLVFLPEAARRTFWVIGIIAALPVLAWGITLITRRFMSYADGAVGNKSSVAALLSVMDYVCEGDVAYSEPVVKASSEIDESAIARPLTRIVTHEEVEEVIGNRHGEAKLRELGILPESCDITYIEPEIHTVEVEEPIEYNDLDETNVFDAQAATTMDIPVQAAQENDAVTDVESDGNPDTTEGDADATRPMNIPVEPRINTDASFDAASLSQLEDGESTDEGSLVETDQSGLNTMADEDAETAADAVRQERAIPSAVDDPEWGKSSYTPDAHAGVSSVARRAALFDLPNIGASSDGLVDDDDTAFAPEVGGTYGMPASSGATVVQMPRSTMAQRLAEASEQMAGAPAPVRLDDNGDASQFVGAGYTDGLAQDNVAYLDTPIAPIAPKAESAAPKRRGLAGLFGRKRKQQQESMSDWLGVDENYDAKSSGENIGSWDNFDDDKPKRSGWKGGAARSVELRGNVLSGLPSLDDEPDPVEASADASSETKVASPDETVMMPASEEILDEAPVAEGDVDTEENGLFAEVPYEGEPIAEETVFDAEPQAEDEVASEAYEPADVLIDREARDAILSMDNDELKKHDVWFVATGASELGHAGVNEFVAGHRKDLRGSFIINLESVGAGRLTALTYEGYGRTRRADRRLLKLLSSAASDMHLELDQIKRTWADTEATPCMRRSLRAVTIMGMDDNELPAYSATTNDSPDVVNKEQILDVVAMITEVIKRS